MKESKKITFVDAPGSREGATVFLRKLAQADNPLAMVSILGSQDMLVALREADDEQKGELLSLASQEQFDGLLDMACWNGDRPDLAGVEKIMAPLVATGMDGAIKAFRALDGEFRTLFLGRYIIVHVREDKDDDIIVPEESEVIAFPDGFYFVEIPDPDHLPDVVRGVMDALVLRPFTEYQPELESVAKELVSELEENALRWRTGRMADQGFGTIEEAMVLMDPLDVQQVRRQIEKAEPPHPLRWEAIIPITYRENLNGNALLDACIDLMSRSEDPVYGRRYAELGAELSAMTSLYLSAVQCDLANVDAVASEIQRARDVLCLGLSALSGDNPVLGARALAFAMPQTVFRAGMGQLVPCMQRARGVLASLQDRVPDWGADFFDTPHRLALTCLSERVPVWWPEIDDTYAIRPDFAEPQPEERIAFSSTGMLATAEVYLAELEQVSDLLFENLRWDGQPGALPGQTSLSGLLLTALANASLGEEPVCRPISGEDAELFAGRFLDQEEDDLIADAMVILGGATGVDREGPTRPQDEKDPTRRLLLRLLHLGRIRLESDDPRMVLLSE